MNVDIIIFAIIALVIAYRFYNTIGIVEDDDPMGPFGNNVVDLNKKDYVINDTGKINPPSEEDLAIEKRLDKKSGKALDEIMKKNSSFRIAKFVSNSEKAFEIIIAAFSAGDKKTLAKLTEKAIEKKFLGECDKLKKTGKTLNINIVAIVKSEVEAISLDGNIANITIRFTSEQISTVADDKGKIVSGDKSKIEEIDDVWVFEKSLSAKDPIWLLVNTL